MKKLLICAIMLLLSCAYAEKCGDYTFSITSGMTAVITGYSGSADELVIPDTLNGYRVTAIADYAFYSCGSLTSVRIPDSVTAVGANPFLECKSLTEIWVSPDSMYLATIDSVLFEKNGRRLVTYPCAFGDNEYTVPMGIETIGESAFSCCALKSISIPESVTTIGDTAFSGCGSLKSMSIPDSVVYIGRNAFRDCGKLIVTVSEGSAARKYCVDNGIKYTYPNALDWLSATPTPTPMPTPTPTPTATPASTPVELPEIKDVSEAPVYYTKGSKYYHLTNNCSGMSPAKADQHTLAEAVTAGKQTCQNCGVVSADLMDYTGNYLWVDSSNTAHTTDVCIEFVTGRYQVLTFEELYNGHYTYCTACRGDVCRQYMLEHGSLYYDLDSETTLLCDYEKTITVYYGENSRKYHANMECQMMYDSRYIHTLYDALHVDKKERCGLCAPTTEEEAAEQLAETAR